MSDNMNSREYERQENGVRVSIKFLQEALDEAEKEKSVAVKASFFAGEVVPMAIRASARLSTLAALDRSAKEAKTDKWNKEFVARRVRDINDVMIEHVDRYEGMSPLQVLMRVRDNVEAWLRE